MSSDYSIAKREEAQDYMAEYPGFGELRSFGGAVDSEQVAFSWRLMPPGTGGRGSYGHKHKSQEEVMFVVSGTVTFKIGDDVFEAGPKTAVRIAPHAVRSIHNDTDQDAEVILCSVRVDDVREDVEMEEDFWPE
ncbi:MAG: Mannose-6-phosphate isomerase [Solirubrobacterales bacterium]|jgi:mannose-6-phosphate isomerase-like protein (cupin superfamily)|nr:Mannose-6-phosphate isomerase [Solirubrobacterales bacterium]